MSLHKRQHPDILELLRDMGLSDRALKRMSRRRRIRRADRPRCTAHRRDGQQCQAHAALDKLTWKPSHGGKCRVHGGLSTGPKTAEGKARIAESNRRRAEVEAALKAASEAMIAAVAVVEAQLAAAHPMPRPDPMPPRGKHAA